MSHQWKEAIVVHTHKKGDKTECSNCRGVSLLSTSILLDPRLQLLVNINVDFKVIDQK
jgi:hypothetical protein